VAFNAVLTWIRITHINNNIAQFASVAWIALACECGEVLLLTGAKLTRVHVASLELSLAEVSTKASGTAALISTNFVDTLSTILAHMLIL
jgi:hypothetical protein